MILHYFYQKENKDKKQVTKIYSRIVKLSNNFAKKNIFIKRGDFQTSFEIFSLFLIIFLKIFRDSNINKYKVINNELIDLFINDLDLSFREIGIGDMKIGKYVKSYIKKFYFRLSTIEKILNSNDSDKLIQFFLKLNFLKKEKVPFATEEILKIYLQIHSSVNNNSKIDKL